MKSEESLCPQCGQPLPFFAGERGAAGDVNPYAAPQAPLDGPGPHGSSSGSQIDSWSLVEALRQTRPWVLFLGVLGFILATVLAVVAVFMFLVGPGGPGFPSVVVALIYAVIAAIYFAAAGYIFSYGRRIGSFLRDRRLVSLTEAVVAQKSFWKLIGIVALVYLLCIAAFLAFGLVFASVGAFR